jgi:hypothetical protein
MAGTWMSIVEGFVECEKRHLNFSKIPKQWKGIPLNQF